MRVLFFGTHPKQFNGYSKVVYELMKCNDVFKKNDIEFSVFGFQKFYENPAHRRDLPVDVPVYDAFANENPKSQGFGFTEVRKVVNEVKPDVCIIYNDMMVLHNVITQIKLAQNEDGLKCKIIAYVDQVYLNQKKEFIDFINKNVDHAILFTPYWEKIIKDQGISVNTDFLRHGFNPMTYFPVPKHLARRFFNLKTDDFIVMNLNRNQPRKRWDICLKAWAEFVSRHKGENVKLLVATAVQGAWNLLELYERELKKRDITLETGMQHIIFIDNPQQITDEETNILYNVADIGINTCDGEGFGLCNFEQAAIGIPQVVPRLGGFIDFFDDTSAMLIDPVMGYYVDNTRDAVCGEALLCDYGDFVEALESLFANADTRARVAAAARKKILSDYKWEDIAASLANIVNKVTGRPDIKKELESIKDEIEKIDISALGNNKTPIPVIEDEEIVDKTVVEDKVVQDDKAADTKPKLDKESRKKQKKRDLAELQKKLAQLLAEDDDDGDDS